MGISHSLEELKTVYSTIHLKTLDEQAVYADHICRSNINSFGVSDVMINDSESFESWNTTSVGNIAYVALNSPRPEVKIQALDTLQRFKNYRENSYSDNYNGYQTK